MESNEVLKMYQGLGPSLQNGENDNLSATHVGMRPDGGTGFGLMISPLASVDGGDGAPVVAKLAVAEDVRRRRPSLIGTRATAATVTVSERRTSQT